MKSIYDIKIFENKKGNNTASKQFEQYLSSIVMLKMAKEAIKSIADTKKAYLSMTLYAFNKNRPLEGKSRSFTVKKENHQDKKIYHGK